VINDSEKIMKEFFNCELPIKWSHWK
jgi:hypothetical protein